MKSLKVTQQAQEVCPVSQDVIRPEHDIEATKTRVKWIFILIPAVVGAGLLLYSHIIKKPKVEVEKQERFRNLIKEGATYEAKKDWIKAVEVYEKALALKPDDNEAKVKLAASQQNLELVRRRLTQMQMLSDRMFNEAQEAELNGNMKTAIESYRRAAAVGNSKAMNNLGNLYLNGQGVIKDYTKAVEWFRKAAEAEDSGAMYNLGVMYHNGHGVTKDYTKAVEWFRKAARAGSSEAMFNLGMMNYRKAQRTTRGSREAHELFLIAAEYFFMASEKGDSEAMNNLAIMFRAGLGVTKDYNEAIGLFRKAARLGNEEAQKNLTELGETW